MIRVREAWVSFTVDGALVEGCGYYAMGASRDDESKALREIAAAIAACPFAGDQSLWQDTEVYVYTIDVKDARTEALIRLRLDAAQEDLRAAWQWTRQVVSPNAKGGVRYGQRRT